MVDVPISELIRADLQLAMLRTGVATPDNMDMMVSAQLTSPSQKIQLGQQVVTFAEQANKPMQPDDLDIFLEIAHAPLGAFLSSLSVTLQKEQGFLLCWPAVGDGSIPSDYYIVILLMNTLTSPSRMKSTSQQSAESARN